MAIETLQTSVQVPITVEGRISPYDKLDVALKALQAEGYNPLFMPALVDAKIQAPRDSPLWDRHGFEKSGYSTPSIVAVGETKQETAVIVYAHIPNYLSVPENIAKEIAFNEQDEHKLSGTLPQEEFQRLLDLEDGVNVFVVDASKLEKWPDEFYGIDSPSKKQVRRKIDGLDMVAINHPQTIPFLGGEERARKYLQRHKEVYGETLSHAPESGTFNIRPPYFDRGDMPEAFLLALDKVYSGISAGDYMQTPSKFVAIPVNVATRIDLPTLEQVLRLSKEFVPDVARPEFENRVTHLFR